MQVIRNLYNENYSIFNLSSVIRKRKKVVMSICVCGNETFIDDGICAVCHVEARFLNIANDNVKEYSISKVGRKQSIQEIIFGEN